MEKDTGQKIKILKVDGGASANSLLMQFQADLLQTKLVRPHTLETTALGAGLMAGLAIGYWKDLSEIKKKWKADKTFSPKMDETTRQAHLQKWQQAIHKTLVA